jgi:phosphopantothenoylcysteine decarboxylase/phosphopantothenate--cysteine ligase
LKENGNKPRILVTAGPTRERIDPVRYLTNASSGAMGLEIARACQKNASVTVVTGPITQTIPKNLRCVSVESAEQMSKAVKRALPKTDVFIATAAVSDWRVKKASAAKLKRGAKKTLTLSLVANPDILAEAGAWKKKMRRAAPLLIGFALETNNVARAMKEKLRRKNLDLIIGNSPSSFGSSAISAFWLEKGGSVMKLGVLKKKELAQRLARWINKRTQS